MLEREASEDERHLDEVVRWLIACRQCLDFSLEEFEGAHAEGAEEPVLRSEQAVDRAGRRTCVTRHLAKGEGVNPLLGDDEFGGVEQRGRGLLVVLPPSAHG